MDKVVQFTQKEAVHAGLATLLEDNVTEILEASKDNALVAIIVRNLDGTTLMSIDTTDCGFGVSTNQLRDSLCDAIKFSYDMEEETEA